MEETMKMIEENEATERTIKELREGLIEAKENGNYALALREFILTTIEDENEDDLTSEQKDAVNAVVEVLSILGNKVDECGFDRIVTLVPELAKFAPDFYNYKETD